jgi:2-polyprenyl-6-methoxyphenol hydroxylase-like FAD-dependent oxidoreductase
MHTEEIKESVPVLIVGGGPVGLALAADLGWRGIECGLVERTDGSIDQPKTNEVNIRTMEFCRRWGIVDVIEKRGYPRDHPHDQVYCTSLTGYEIARHPILPFAQQTPPPTSPQKKERCPQLTFDPILAEFARSRPSVTLRYRCQFESFVQRPDGVECELTDLTTGRKIRVRAQFVAACDGGNSRIRDALGIKPQGVQVLAYSTNILFTANLESLHDKGRAVRFLFIEPDGNWANLMSINGSDQWRLQILGDTRPWEQQNLDINASIRRAIGCEFFDYKIHSVQRWLRRAVVADRYRGGRIFLVGDAAHQLTPTGGFGMNTGVGDAIDLSWKFQAVIEGWGGAALLESYETERRPIGIRNVNEATDNFYRQQKTSSNPALLEATPEGTRVRAEIGERYRLAMHKIWENDGVQLGYYYDGSPICVADGTPPPADDPVDYHPTARPGSRAPHVWLGEGRSLIDLYGRGFVLLRIGPDAPDVTAIVEAANQRGVPVQVIGIINAEVASLYERRLALIRPDGHVAWRADDPPASAVDLIDCVRGARTRVDDRELVHSASQHNHRE